MGQIAGAGNCDSYTIGIVSRIRSVHGKLALMATIFDSLLIRSYSLHYNIKLLCRSLKYYDDWNSQTSHIRNRLVTGYILYI